MHALQVYLTSAAPPVRCPNVYGIDIPTKTELVAYNRTPEEVSRNTKVYLVVYKKMIQLSLV